MLALNYGYGPYIGSHLLMQLPLNMKLVTFLLPLLFVIGFLCCWKERGEVDCEYEQDLSAYSICSFT